MNPKIIKLEIEKLFKKDNIINQELKQLLSLFNHVMDYERYQADKYLVRSDLGHHVIAAKIRVLVDYYQYKNYLSEKFDEFCKTKNYTKIKALLTACQLILSPIGKKDLRLIKQTISGVDNPQIKNEIIELLRFYGNADSLYQEALTKLSEARNDIYIGKKISLLIESYKYLKLSGKKDNVLLNKIVNSLIPLTLEYKDYHPALIDIAITERFPIAKSILENVGKYCVEKEDWFYALYCYSKLKNKDLVRKILEQANNYYQKRIEASMYG